jgi:hypothetical protein
MKRRNFLAGIGLGGYSLIVRADGAEPGTPPQIAATGAKPEFRTIAPADADRKASPAEPHMTQVDLDVDVFIAGGGMSGVIAAVSAARHGAKVVLVQDRSRLGGNASSEVKMHIVGANHHKSRPGWREGGLLEEFRLDDAANNPQRCWELWDLLLYDKCVSEPNLTLLVDTVLFAVDKSGNRITAAYARCDKTEHIYKVRAKNYIDCTGDGRLGLEAGADMRYGRESRSDHGEPLAPETPDKETMGSSILFTSRKYDKPMPFTPPKWARKITKKQLAHRGVKAWEYGYWWIEWGGQMNTIHDNERIRFELLSIVMGVWDYIKNSGDIPASANWAMDWVGMIPGKRESRRFLGDHILTQQDLMGLTGDFEDGVAIGGWPMDDHPPGGFDRDDLPPCVQVKTPVYNIPYRSLYSRNVENLMLGGRLISATHAAFTSTRVMATCSVVGQAVGTAAALCAKYDCPPRTLWQDKAKLAELRQTLLRDDQSIVGLKNDDGADLARSAKVTASGETEDGKAANVVNGFVRDIPGEYVNRWSTELADDGAWLDLSWDKPQKLSQVQLTFDSGFQRELTLTSSDGITKTIVRAPQPETVRDYEIVVTDSAGKETSVVKVDGNHQRLCRHTFEAVEAKSLRIKITATNGDKLARVFEVRAYA